ncbi:MAG: DNA polymerase IV [Clostridiales bacterium]|jgi:DNA polymerase-4|nr:DNA polymerase IV [Clostridiales bacterium]
MKTILHCDLNNFYASVETALNPELKDKPVAVCGEQELRHGIVLAKSYPAKACGIATGDTVTEAKRKCPNLIVLPPHFEEYVKYSDKVFAIHTSFTDRVENYGLDECWLDVTNSSALFGGGEKIADEIRRRVKDELNLTISVGVSFTKIFAKLGSDMKKPDATTVISPENFKDKIYRLPAEELMMVGKSTKNILNRLNIRTIGELAAADKGLLKQHLGINGEKLIDSANGRDNDEVRLYYDKFLPASVGHGTTTPTDMTSYDDAAVIIYALSELVASRLRRYGLHACGVHLSVKNSRLKSFGKQRALNAFTSNSKDIAENACALLQELWSPSENYALRAVTVSAINLIKSGDMLNINFFDDIDLKPDNLENSLDKIRSKYGFGSIKRGILLKNSYVADDRFSGDNKFLPFSKGTERS